MYGDGKIAVSCSPDGGEADKKRKKQHNKTKNTTKQRGRNEVKYFTRRLKFEAEAWQVIGDRWW